MRPESRRRGAVARGALLAMLAVLAAGSVLAGCYDSGSYSPTESNLRKIITLRSESGATSLAADGFSRLRLEAQLLGEPALDRRTVVFRTSLGTLAGGTASGDAMTVEADDSGIARIDLVSASTPGTAIVTASPMAAAGVTASLQISFVPPDPDDVIRFVSAPARAPADGATQTPFTVAVSPDLVPGGTVTFTTTVGQIVPAAPVPVDADGRASADLVSPVTIGSARVTATIQGVSRSTTIAFERALPDLVTVSADQLSVPASNDSRVMVTAGLHRDVGQVTDGTVVTFAAFADDGARVGSFGNVTLSANGMATAVFLPGDTAPGFVTLVVGAQGTSVTGSLRIELTAP